MSIATALMATTDTVNPLPFPPAVFGIIGGCIFLVLLLVTWSYRDVANRHSYPAAPDAAEHAGAPGAAHHGASHTSGHESGH